VIRNRLVFDHVFFFCLPLIAIPYARCLFSKDTNMSAYAFKVIWDYNEIVTSWAGDGCREVPNDETVLQQRFFRAAASNFYTNNKKSEVKPGVR
jgi:hypothetical protein